MRDALQTVEKASQSFLRKQKIKLKTFSAGACTRQKILLRLQVWNLSAISRQMMRAADCKELAESPEGDFRQARVHPMRDALFPDQLPVQWTLK